MDVRLKVTTISYAARDLASRSFIDAPARHAAHKGASPPVFDVAVVLDADSTAVGVDDLKPNVQC